MHLAETLPDVSEADIARLVDAFYARIRAHPALGPVFHAALGEDEAAWAPHLHKLRRFWSAIMLRSGAYHGDPFTAHLRLEGLTPALFGEWLALFDSTCADLFPADLAGAFSERAHRIARSLQLGVFRDLPG
jgi:hemoglobin